MKNIVGIPNNIQAQTLTEAMKKAEKISDSFQWPDNNIVLGISDLNVFFQKLIISIALKKGYIMSIDFYSCIPYVSSFLQRFGHELPKSWYAIDFINQCLNEKNPEILRTGGETCFFICTFLPAWTEKDVMHYEDYVYFGINFYQMYHDTTQKPIGFWMSNYFPGLVECVFEAVQKMQEKHILPHKKSAKTVIQLR